MTGSRLNDGLEQKQLLAAIAQIERNLALPVNREVSSALLTYLNLLKTRLCVLEEKQKTLDEQKERTENLQRAVVLVERETALNEDEKEQYLGFLQQEYFTKTDFSSLEQFYGNSWGKLTEGGKAQMSHRVWEGVRREEYQFTDLPETLKDKEAQRLRDAFHAAHKNLREIPDVDRNDFIAAWDGGRKHDSYKVLDRPSFTKSVATSVAAELPASVVTAEAVNGNAVKDAMNSKLARNEKPTATPELMVAVEFKADGLAGISFCTPDMQPPLSGSKKPDAALVKGQ